MFDDPRPYTFDRVVRMVLTAAVLIALFLLVRYLADVLIPFAAAVILAYLLNPIVSEFEKRFQRRGSAVAFTMVGFFVVILAMFVIVAPLMAIQWNRFEDSLAKLRADVSGAVSAAVYSGGSATPEPVSLSTSAPASQPTLGEKEIGWRALQRGWMEYAENSERLPRSIRLRRLFQAIQGTYLGDAANRLVAYMNSEDFGRFAWTLVGRLFAGGVTVINLTIQIVVGATVIIIVLIYLVLLLLDYPAYERNWKAYLPPAHRDSIINFLREFQFAMRRYFRGQFVIALITAILFSIGFTIIGLPMAIPFGLFIGMLNMVPYLQSVALIPAFCLAVLRSVETGSLIGSILLLLAVWGTIQIIQDGILTPKIMGKATGLRPVAILLGVFIWGKLLGVLGLLLAIPLTCLGIAYYRRFVLRHSRQATTLAEPPAEAT